MSDEQTLELASALQRYAPAIIDTCWHHDAIELLTVSQQRIDPVFMPALERLANQYGFALMIEA